jgi:hypothetical protein
VAEVRVPVIPSKRDLKRVLPDLIKDGMKILGIGMESSKTLAPYSISILSNSLVSSFNYSLSLFSIIYFTPNSVRGYIFEINIFLA